MKRVYLVEDEANLRKLLIPYLENEGYEVTAFSNGLDAEKVIGNAPDIWVLDIMLPGMDGYTLIKRIKEETPETPVIFMSARSAELDRVVGLEMGSDDYLPKPFLPRELVLRVNRLLRLRGPAEPIQQSLKIGAYTVYFDRRTVEAEGQELDLTIKEFEVLKYLMDHANQAVKRAQVIDAVWGQDYYGSERVVDDTLRRLRKKMPNLVIEPVYGYGYRFKME